MEEYGKRPATIRRIWRRYTADGLTGKELQMAVRAAATEILGEYIDSNYYHGAIKRSDKLGNPRIAELVASQRLPKLRVELRKLCLQWRRQARGLREQAGGTERAMSYEICSEDVLALLRATNKKKVKVA